MNDTSAIPPFDDMNETDVCQHILRPLLHDLGYRLGTPANIRTEVHLSYAKIFLGRKKPSDPDLPKGRLDFLCDLVGVARWIVEAKSPYQEINIDDVHQAHSYAVHSEINATYFLVSNGRTFQLYQTSEITQPLLQFEFHELEQHRPDLLRLLSPASLRERHRNPLSRLIKGDGDTALAAGWAPQAKIMGGWLQFVGIGQADPSRSSRLQAVIGRRAIVVGEFAYRTNEGDMKADLKIVQPIAELDEYAKLMGLDRYSVQCADRSMSMDVAKPTIFTGQITGSIPANIDLSKLPGAPPRSMSLPWPVRFVVDTRAVGFLEGNTFKGSFEYIATYDVDLGLVPLEWRQQIQHHLQLSQHSIYGEMELQLMSVARSSLPVDLDVLR